MVMGLVGSLVSTYKIPEEVALHYTTDGFGSRFKDAVAPLRFITENWQTFRTAYES